MKKFGIFLLLVLILVKNAELKLFADESEKIMRDLISYNSAKIKQNHEKIHDYYPETVYYSPYQTLEKNENFTKNMEKLGNAMKGKITKRNSDTTFRGKPKTIEEVWHQNFNFAIQEFAQSSSLIDLMKKIITKYLGACIPVVLYDAFVAKSEGYTLQRLFETFPTSFIHGLIGKNFTIDRKLLEPPDAKCRSYILFVSDATQTRKVLGPQVDNRVVVVPRSTQWKLQEFLSSPSSRDIINLLVIGESYSADKTKERPYVLYTHQLYVDGLGSNKPKVLTSWLKGRLSRPHIDLFPPKLTKGFAGHRFSVSAAHFPPFVFKKLSTDGVGNLQIRWDGYEFRILTVLGRRLNFTFDVNEPKSLLHYGPGDAVGEAVGKRTYDIGMSGMYVTTERNSMGTEMSVAHDNDCAAFITLTSKALPRYRAILGPFQWQVWMCLTLIYLVAIIPLAYSDSLSIRYLIEKPGQIENMFWYVFGTFTNSLTFSGELSWSNSKKTSTRILIGFYWVFTIIITACYTGSIIAFVTLPVFPETVDSLSQLQNGFYRIGTLDRGGWERWFVNSSQKETARLLRNLEFVKDVDEGLSNVTKAYFLFPYAFIGSKQQLSYIIRSNYSDEKLGRRSSLHISDECFALFGVGFAFQMQSVYRQKINDGILLLLQSGIIQKIKNDVRWDMLRSDSGGYLQISKEKTLRISAKERGLTLADTEGMFLLLGIGFVVAGGVLISEWVGGIGNKCMQFMRIKREAKEELHRVEEDQRRDDENAKFVVDESARNALVSASSMLEGITFGGERKHSLEVENHEKHIDGGSRSSRSSKQSQSSSLNIADLNPAMLTEMFRGRNRASNIVCIEGQMMSEEAATQYANDFKKSTEDQRGSFQSDISKTFDFLNKESDEDENDMHDQKRSPPQVCEVEINLQAPSPSAIKDGEEFFGEKIDGPKGVKTD